GSELRRAFIWLGDGRVGRTSGSTRFDRLLWSPGNWWARARRGPLLCHWEPLLGRKDWHALLHRGVFLLSPSCCTRLSFFLQKRLGFLTSSPLTKVGVGFLNFHASGKGLGILTSP
ncbi:unnamed protein product, partial [Musa textilis]